jgi:hypothetical protein
MPRPFAARALLATAALLMLLVIGVTGVLAALAWAMLAAAVGSELVASAVFLRRGRIARRRR